jgi:hypothetical protein
MFNITNTKSKTRESERWRRRWMMHTVKWGHLLLLLLFASCGGVGGDIDLEVCGGYGGDGAAGLRPGGVWGVFPSLNRHSGVRFREPIELGPNIPIGPSQMLFRLTKQSNGAQYDSMVRAESVPMVAIRSVLSVFCSSFLHTDSSWGIFGSLDSYGRGIRHHDLIS